MNTKVIDTAINESQTRCFAYIKRMKEDRPIRKVYKVRPANKKSIGRPRKIWKKEIRTKTEKRKKLQEILLTQDKKNGGDYGQEIPKNTQVQTSYTREGRQT